jgi:pyruvate kinase
MKRNRNVKIVATLGPASSSHEVIKDLFLAGVDVFRLNMSHGTHDDIRARHSVIRKVEEEVGRPICILADLQGPKLRVGTFANGPVKLSAGDSFRVDLDETPGSQDRVCLPHVEIFKAMEKGSRLLVNDGKIVLRVTSFSDEHADCVVEVGGEISDRKGVNVPDVVLSLDALSPKDREDLEFACELGVEWLGLSFVQKVSDIDSARELAKSRAKVLTKVEKPAAVKNFTEILEASDGIMVARGDLGVEMPLQSIPSIQKSLIRQCRNVGKPVIVATQMLESMISSPIPTRAEVSDVATAIYEGADAVMLSAESAVGKYPAIAVKTMDEIAQSVESDPTHRAIIEASRTKGRSDISHAIAVAAREVAETTALKGICCFTTSGTTAYLVARERPRVPVIALTPSRNTARTLSLVWGLHCFQTGHVKEFKDAVGEAVRAAKEDDFAKKGETIVVTAGIPFNQAGSTNIIRVAEVD